MIELELILFGALIMLFSAFVKGISGFGTAIFAVPLLVAFVFLPSEARVIVVSLNLFLNIFILARENSLTKANVSEISTLMIPGFIFAIATGFFLGTVDDTLFRIILGTLLVLTAFNKFFDFPYKITHVRRYYPTVGSLSGILNTLIGVGGIPILIFLSNTPYEKARFRRTLMLFFLAINTGSVLTFAVHGAYRADLLIYILAFVPFVLLGSLLGMALVPRINNLNFNRIVAVLLLIMGISNLFNIL